MALNAYVTENVSMLAVKTSVKEEKKIRIQTHVNAKIEA